MRKLSHEEAGGPEVGLGEITIDLRQARFRLADKSSVKANRTNNAPAVAVLRESPLAGRAAPGREGRYPLKPRHVCVYLTNRASR